MSKRATLYLETTKVPASKSIGEITGLLVRFGARSIETIYETGTPAGLSWSVMLYDRAVYFRMPAKTEPVYKRFRKQIAGSISLGRDQNLKDRAERVAWRQMLAWVQVQLALIEIGMVEYAQTFLPYLQDGPGGRTMWDAALETQFRRIEAPKQTGGSLF
jgi:hypothetical protein